MSELRQIYSQFIAPRIQIDDRSLAVFRVLVGLLLIIDTLLRFRSLSFFYTDKGAVPASLVQEHTTAISVLYYFTDPLSVSIIFGLKIIVGVLLLIGFRTRIVTIISVLLVTSIDARNPLVLSYGDDLLRLLLFWGIFLPLGNKWSVDSLLRSDIPQEWSVVNKISGVLVLLQIVAMYIVNFSQKWVYKEMWFSGYPLQSTVHTDSVSWLLGPFLKALPEVLFQVATSIWFLCLLFSPLLVVFTGRKRYIYAGVLMLGHTFLFFITRIGLLSFIIITGLVLFVQTQFWKDIEEYSVGRYGSFVGSISGYIERIYPSVDITSDSIKRGIRVVSVGILLISAMNMVAMTALHSEYNLNPNTEADTLTTSFNSVNDIYSIVSVHQPNWNFNAGEQSVDMYFVFAAETTTGETYDVFNNRDRITFDRQYGSDLHTQYQTYRHRYYYTWIYWQDTETIGSELAEYHCQNWDGDGQLRYLTLYTVEQFWTEETIGSPEEYRNEVTVEVTYDCLGSNPQTVGAEKL